MNQFLKNNQSQPLSDDQIKFWKKYRTESTRLKEYDYSKNGAYFITICTKNREHFFGDIIDGKLLETKRSKICLACWLDLPNHYENCILDFFVIMPNHVHLIIFIENNDDKKYPVSEIIRGFKTFTARKINDFQNTTGTPFWQSRFYDRIIRTEDELSRIRQYVQNNPANWENDRNNVENIYM
jgi:REP element-mobilizing transposase RayT